MKYVQTAALVGICIAGLYLFVTLQNIFASFGAMLISGCAGILATRHQIIRLM